MNLSSDPINTLENLIAKNKSKNISIYLAVVLAIATFIVLLPAIKVDISSQSRGIIRSKTDNVPLATVVSGKIVALHLKNNLSVAKGDTLLTISNENLTTEKQLNDTLVVSNEIILKDLKRALESKSDSLETSMIRKEYYQFVAQKTELQSKISQATSNFRRQKILFGKDVIAKAEYEKYLFELRFATQALASYIKQQTANWQNKKNELELQLKNYAGANNKLQVEAKNYVLIAPISGTIEGFSGLQVGSNITASQPIAQISPTENLIVESTVSPNDIGLIKTKQKVKFQLDAFNYNQWGMLTGKVIDIDKNITLQDNQAYFKVRCALDTKELKLKSGYTTEVSKGMTLTTRYIITRRSLYDLLFDKVDDWLNPKRITN
ncbi:HlyD family secretion protein [Flavobacterium sp.]|jgi:HlyD family secretion protein|uniref:HlyD family secretion protein n=1 Tax=Flavobacterium sp. TaxID=239 RepID=UPI0037BED5D0